MWLNLDLSAGFHVPCHVITCGVTMKFWNLEILFFLFVFFTSKTTKLINWTIVGYCWLKKKIILILRKREEDKSNPIISPFFFASIDKCGSFRLKIKLTFCLQFSQSASRWSCSICCQCDIQRGREYLKIQN